MEKKKFKDKYEYNDNDNNNYIGEGGFGRVFKAKIKNTNEERALKIINKKKLIQSFKSNNRREPTDEEKKKYFDDLLNEIKYMKMMEDKNKNENTVKFYEHFDFENEFIFVMELCDENLDDFLNRKQSFNVDEIYYILTQLNNSFQLMNKLKLVHRDLTLKNILVKYKNKEKTKYTLKLSDYGISKRLIDVSKFYTQKGTLQFMAPEVIKGKGNEECDLWSLGIIIYMLFKNEFPFQGDQPFAVYNQIQENQIEINTGNDDLNDLITKLLNPSPKERLSWKDYFDHPFFINNPNRIIQEENYIFIKVKVSKSDKDESKNIYFLDNDSFMKEKRPYIYKENEEIKSLLKEKKIEIYINEELNENNNKYFKPEKEGTYEIKIIFKKKMKNCSFMFSGCGNIISIDLSSFDASDVTNMYYMFGKCFNLEEINIENLNTENVTDMSYMFNNCTFKKIIFPNSFKTQNVKNMSFMFHFCLNLTEINFSSSFKTDNVIKMKGMFGKCYNLKSLDLTNFNTSKAENMSFMFDQCSNLEKILINPSTFITKNSKDLGYMFNQCENLKNIELSSFNTEKSEFFNYMFSDCKNLKNLDLSKFKILDKANMTHMFEGCTSLEELNLSSFNISKQNETNNMLDDLTKIKKIIVNKNYIDNFKEILKDNKSVLISL